MTRDSRLHRRELERELTEIPTPPPPHDLLDRICAGIPSHLRAANHSDSGAPAPRSATMSRRFAGTNWFRLAAGLAVAAIGLAVALQLGQDRTEELPLKRKTPTASAPSPATSPSSASPRVDSRGSKRIVAEAQPLPTLTPGARSSSDERQASPGKENHASGATAAPAPPSLKASVRPGREADLPAAPSGARDAARPQEPKKISSLSYLGAANPASDQARSEPMEIGAGEKVEVIAEAPAVQSRKISAGATVPESSESARGSRSSSGEFRGSGRYLAPPPGVGGERAPNEAAAPDMFFRAPGTNPFVDTEEDPLSTFGLDVDTGSWTLARSYLERGALPPAEAIRVEEFVNAQAYDDPAPRRSDFTLVAEGAPSPFAPAGDYRLLRFAVRSRDLAPRERRPAALTFVVDVSGSMDRENRLGMVKRALGLLLSELGPDDRVALVVYGSNGRVLLRHTRDLGVIREAIDSLRPGGSTNAEEGLRLGYDLAGEAYRAGAINRLILCSDGVANVGATGPESILARIGREARRGIELTTVGFGMGNYNDALMEQLADQGDGSYHYVDSLEEARRIFVDELEGTLETVARDAKVQVEFDPRTVERWRLVGYENRDVADRDFRNDRVDAGEVGAGRSAVALYEVRLAPHARRASPLATLRLRWKSVASGAVEESALTLRAGDLERSFEAASPDLRRAAVAAELAEMLKGSFYARGASWHALSEAAHRLDGVEAPRGGDLVFLVDRAALLARDGRPVPVPLDDD